MRKPSTSGTDERSDVLFDVNSGAQTVVKAVDKHFGAQTVGIAVDERKGCAI